MKNISKIIRKKCDFIDVEQRGIERILPEERTDRTILDTTMIWVKEINI